MTILKYYDETDAAWKPFVNNASDAVTLSGDQTIAGKKTFTEDMDVAGDIYSNGEKVVTEGSAPQTSILGYAEKTSAQGKPTGTGPFAVTDLSTSFSLSESTWVKMTAWTPNFENTGSLNSAKISLHNGTVGSGTVIAEAASSVHANGYYESMTATCVRELSAGSYTINVGMGSTGTGTLKFNAYTGNRAFLLIERL